MHGNDSNFRILAATGDRKKSEREGKGMRIEFRNKCGKMLTFVKSG